MPGAGTRVRAKPPRPRAVRQRVTVSRSSADSERGRVHWTPPAGDRPPGLAKERLLGWRKPVCSERCFQSHQDPAPGSDPAGDDPETEALHLRCQSSRLCVRSQQSVSLMWSHRPTAALSLPLES